MEHEPQNEALYQELKRELRKMRDADQEMIKGAEYDHSLIKRNTERVKEIMEKYGWLGKSRIDDDGSDFLWLLIQHSDHDVEFQKKALELLREAVEKGEASKRNLAYLIDRVRVNSGELQLFGTQFEGGKLEPKPIEDMEHLEERRKEYGLEPFEEYRKMIEEARSERKQVK